MISSVYFLAYSIILLTSIIHTEIIQASQLQLQSPSSHPIDLSVQNSNVKLLSPPSTYRYRYSIMIQQNRNKPILYYSWNMNKQPCMYGYVYNKITDICQLNSVPKQNITVCNMNQVLVNGSCQCDNLSIYSNGSCIRCQYSTFKYQQNQQCKLCSHVISYCVHCQNQYKCLNCQRNMQVATHGGCVCVLPYYISNGVCRKCMEGTTYNAQTNTCEGITTDTDTHIQTIYNKLTKYIDPNTLSDIIAQKLKHPKCSTNEQLKNGVCICNEQTVNISGQCQLCEPGTYKYVYSCYPCSEHCNRCNNFMDCVECEEGFVYNRLYSICQPSCPRNQVLYVNQCVCQRGTGRDEDGICQMCLVGTISYRQKCVVCAQNCKVCHSHNKCSQCKQQYSLNLITLQCCPNNQTYNSITEQCQCRHPYHNISNSCQECNSGLTYHAETYSCISSDQCGNLYLNDGQECDDGNNVSGDGCSEACLLENGYLCSYGYCWKVIDRVMAAANVNGTISMGFRYLISQLYRYTSYINANITRGPTAKHIQIIKPHTDPNLIIVLISYEKPHPYTNITVELQLECQLGRLKYTSQYQISTLSKNIDKSIKEKDQILV